jgi:hypothetical protein
MVGASQTASPAGWFLELLDDDQLRSIDRDLGDRIEGAIAIR